MRHRYIYTLLIAPLIAAVGCPVAGAEPALPDIGQSAASILTPAEERRTGEAIVRNIRRAGGLLEDLLLTDYINRLGYQLLAHTENPDQHTFQFFIVDDSRINAFALPGGFIGINYGLIIASDTESELASVLAHEIAHITQRHHARAYENAGDSQLPVLAALIAAMILGSKGSEVGEAALASAAAGTIQQQINFTRHNEEEADRIGIQMLSKAQFDAQDMARFFDKLDKESRLHGAQIPEYLRTHPVNTQRITDAYHRATNQSTVKAKDDLTYQLMKQRILALTTKDTHSALQQKRAQLKTSPHEVNRATQYGYALLLSRAKYYQESGDIIDKLVQADPHRIAYLLAQAEIKLKNGQHQAALQLYETAAKLYPNHEAITHDYAAALLKTGQADKAKVLIENQIKISSPHPQLYRFLAQSAAMLKKPAESHAAMGEFYYATGLLHQAVEQFELALKNTSLDFYTLSRIEARLAQIKREIPSEPTQRTRPQNISNY